MGTSQQGNALIITVVLVTKIQYNDHQRLIEIKFNTDFQFNFIGTL